MDKIVTEIIIGAIIFALLISIIPIYRNSAELISAAGGQVDMNEKIKEVSFSRLPKENDFVSGSYLVELAHYLDTKYKYEISIKMGNKMNIIKNNSSYDYSKINRKMIFEVTKSSIKNNFIKLEFVD